jgi:hypothetical protein
MRSALALVFLVFAVAEARTAERLDLETVNGAELKSQSFTEGKLDAVVVSLLGITLYPFLCEIAGGG